MVDMNIEVERAKVQCYIGQIPVGGVSNAVKCPYLAPPISGRGWVGHCTSPGVDAIDRCTLYISGRGGGVDRCALYR